MGFLTLSFIGGCDTFLLGGDVSWGASSGVVCEIHGRSWVSDMNTIRSKSGSMFPIVILTTKVKAFKTNLFVFNRNILVTNGSYEETYQLLKDFVFEVHSLQK